MLVLPSLATLAGPASLLKVGYLPVERQTDRQQHQTQECTWVACIREAAVRDGGWMMTTGPFVMLTNTTQIVGGMGFAWLALWLTIGKEIPHR